MTYSCEPLYPFRPAPSSTPCIMPGFPEHRSRVFVTRIFVRSIDQGQHTNNISIELTNSDGTGHFIVYIDNAISTQYTVTFGDNSIENLRTMINNDPTSIIEMPVLNYDKYDTRIDEVDVVDDLEPDHTLPSPTGGLYPFARISLTGGSGGPTTNEGIALINTGPYRTMFTITTTEDDTGRDTDPQPPNKVRQWDGGAWVEYNNYTPGICP